MLHTLSLEFDLFPIGLGILITSRLPLREAGVLGRKLIFQSLYEFANDVSMAMYTSAYAASSKSLPDIHSRVATL